MSFTVAANGLLRQASSNTNRRPNIKMRDPRCTAHAARKSPAAQPVAGFQQHAGLFAPFKFTGKRKAAEATADDYGVEGVTIVLTCNEDQARHFSASVICGRWRAWRDAQMTRLDPYLAPLVSGFRLERGARGQAQPGLLFKPLA